MASRPADGAGSVPPTLGDPDNGPGLGDEAPTLAIDARSSPPRGRDATTAVLGRYPVVGVLGMGGMGRVLEVTDTSLGRRVAAKVILGTPDARLREKFLLEARVTGQLEHPNIVPLHELGVTADGLPYFTMKRVEGQDLAHLIARPGTPLPLLAKLQVFLKVCHAVAFAHSRGVIHRDLKPANVMVGTFGEVLVMDWGLAKVLGRADDAAASLTPDRAAFGVGDALTTLDGSILGTPAYMPPEQAEGRAVELDERADIYALGGILYELLTHAPPYVGATGWQVLAQVLDGTLVAPLKRAPARAIPWELEAVVLRAMAREPNRRYPDVPALVADIERFLEGRTLDAARYSTVQRAAKWLRRHPALVAAGLLAGVMLGGFALYLGVWRPRREASALAREARDRLRQAGVPLEAPAPSVLPGADERVLAAHLEAVGLFDRALARRARDRALREERRMTGQRLARLALAAGDHTLAAYAFRELSQFGAASAEVEAGLAEVEASRSRPIREGLSRLDQLLASLATGELGAGLRLDDVVHRGAGLRDSAAIERLARVTDGYVESQRASPGRVIDQGERLQVVFAVRVLARLELVEGDAPLLRLLAVVEDQELAVEAGRALCLLRSPRGASALLALQRRLGYESRAWQQIRPAFVLLPELAVEGLAETAAFFLERANQRVQRGELAGALADLDQAMAKAPSADAHRTRGDVRMLQGKPTEAISDYDRAIAADPTPAHLTARAMAHDRAGNRDAALGDIERALVEGATARRLTVRGLVRIHRGELDLAVVDLRAALVLDPDYHEALADLANALDKLRRPAEALSYRERVVVLLPDQAQSWHDRAVTRDACGDKAGALADADRAVELDPATALWRALRGELRLRAKDAQGAYDDSEVAIRSGGAGANRAHRLRGFLRLGRGEREAALEDMDRAVALDPNDPRSYFDRGMLRVHLGQGPLGLTDLQRSLELDASNWQAWAQVGFLLAAGGRRDEAVTALRRAIPLAPASERAGLEAHVASLLR